MMQLKKHLTKLKKAHNVTMDDTINIHQDVKIKVKPKTKNKRLIN